MKCCPYSGTVFVWLWSIPSNISKMISIKVCLINHSWIIISPRQTQATLKGFVLDYRHLPIISHKSNVSDFLHIWSEREPRAQTKIQWDGEAESNIKIWWDQGSESETTQQSRNKNVAVFCHFSWYWTRDSVPADTSWHLWYQWTAHFLWFH